MLPNDLQSSYTGGTVPTVIGDLAGAASSIYGAVTGRPVATVQSQVIATQQGYAGGTGSGGLLMLVLIGAIVYLVVKEA